MGGKFLGAADGRIDSWAYRWTHAVWRQGMLSIVPYQNLVSNIGFGAGATHTRETHPLADLPVFPMNFPLVHPPAIARDAAADERTSRRVFRRPSLPARAWRRLGRIFT